MQVARALKPSGLFQLFQHEVCLNFCKYAKPQIKCLGLLFYRLSSCEEIMIHAHTRTFNSDVAFTPGKLRNSDSHPAEFWDILGMEQLHNPFQSNRKTHRWWKMAAKLILEPSIWRFSSFLGVSSPSRFVQARCLRVLPLHYHIAGWEILFVAPTGSPLNREYMDMY